MSPPSPTAVQTRELEKEPPLRVFGRVLDCRVQLDPPLTVWITVPVPVKLPPPTAQPLFASEKQSPRRAYGVGLETGDQEVPPLAERSMTPEFPTATTTLDVTNLTFVRS